MYIDLVTKLIWLAEFKSFLPYQVSRDFSITSISVLLVPAHGWSPFSWHLREWGLRARPG